MDVEAEEEIGPRLREIGISAADVRWVVLTHLHTDHAGGLYHFPHSEILLARAEYGVARGLLGRARGYLPHRWPEWFAPRLVDFGDEAVGQFPGSHRITRDGDVQLVPTPGHSAGHLSVIVKDGEDVFFLEIPAELTVFEVGDGYVLGAYEEQIDGERHVVEYRFTPRGMQEE